MASVVLAGQMRSHLPDCWDLWRLDVSTLKFHCQGLSIKSPKEGLGLRNCTFNIPSRGIEGLFMGFSSPLDWNLWFSQLLLQLARLGYDRAVPPVPTLPLHLRDDAPWRNLYVLRLYITRRTQWFHMELHGWMFFFERSKLSASTSHSCLNAFCVWV